MYRVVLGSLSIVSWLVISPGDAVAQVPPTPFDLVSQLDFECRPADGIPVAPTVFVRQLNPVLKDRIPNQQVPLGALEEVCVPVAKNGQIPSQAALAFIRWLDVACYKAASPPTGVEVHLSHLNPVLANLPDEDVTLGALEQICLPVKKNGVEPPPAVRALASHFDLGCYGLEEPTSDANRTLVLTHLNPVIRALDPNLPDRTVTMGRARQLCVPIGKNNQPVPPGVLSRVEWADFLKYRVTPHDPIPPLPLWLKHLNPIYAEVDRFLTILRPDWVRLMVPVAKDGHLPPGD
jgi:hypothetical protein